MAQLKLMKKEWFNWFDKTFLDNITAWTEYYYINPDSQHWISNNIYSISDVNGVENGVTYSSSNGIIRMKGTWTGPASGFISALEKVIYLKAGTYALSAFNPEAIDPAYVVRFRVAEVNYSVIAEKQLDSPNESLTFTLSTDREVRIFLRMGEFSSEDDFILKPMLVPGNAAPEAFSPHLIKIEDILDVINMQDINWSYNSQYQVFYGYIPSKKIGRTNVFSTMYKTVDKHYSDLSDMEISGTTTDNGINVKNLNYTDPQAFRTAMKNMYFIVMKMSSPY